MDLTLREVQSIAAKRFPFDVEHYPAIPNTKKDASHFAQRHLHLHLSKNLGEIATAIEPKDHGARGATISAQVIRKLLVNALRLADMSGVSMQDIQASINNWYNRLED